MFLFRPLSRPLFRLAIGARRCSAQVVPLLGAEDPFVCFIGHTKWVRNGSGKRKCVRFFRPLNRSHYPIKVASTPMMEADRKETDVLQSSGVANKWNVLNCAYIVISLAPVAARAPHNANQFTLCQIRTIRRIYYDRQKF